LRDLGGGRKSQKEKKVYKTGYRWEARVKKGRRTNLLQMEENQTKRKEKNGVKWTTHSI